MDNFSRLPICKLFLFDKIDRVVRRLRTAQVTNSEGANYANCEEREEREEGIISLIVHSKRLLNR